MKTVETKLPVGEIIDMKKLPDGTWVVTQKVFEAPKEEVHGAWEYENLFVRVEASKLSQQDKFMQYTPRTKQERVLKNLLNEVIQRGIKDFYRPIIDPSFDEDDMICFKFGMQPAVGKSYKWWEENAKKFNPKRKSRLGTKSEYVAFLGVLLKKLIEEGWSLDESWNAVCNNSKKLGHYGNSENAKYDYEPTGSREICGFFDLANTMKLLSEDNDNGGFWLAGGWVFGNSKHDPLANLGNHELRSFAFGNRVGWIVCEK